MYRFCYRAQYENAEIFTRISELTPHIDTLLREKRLNIATVFSYDNRNLFFYIEIPSAAEKLTPEKIFPGLVGFLAPWAGEAEPRYFIPMLEIYHSYDPSPEEEGLWERKETVLPRAMMSQMYPEKLASYIFWHHQRYLESPGRDGKYLSIWCDGEMALLYGEAGDKAVEHPRAAELATHNTPEDWAGVMIPHFREFADGKLYHNAELRLCRSHADL